MIVVQEIFVCKPGSASKLAKKLKDAWGDYPEVKRVMTDMVGQYNRVIMESEYEDMDAYMKTYEEYMDPTAKMKTTMKKMEGYTDMYLTGMREIYRTW